MARLVLPYISFIVFLLLMCMVVQPGTGTIHGDEVKALGEIAEQLGKKDWNTNVEQCIKDLSWLTPKSDWKPPYNNSLFCNCSYPDSVCHVVALSIGNNLFSGMVPLEVGKLVNLENLILSANNLSGELPVALTNLTKLKELPIDLSYNNLSERSAPSCRDNLLTLLQIFSVTKHLPKHFNL
ncbi:hypothetical protein SO802_006569 [Lithocarpus litseifolius]|uniref:Leucine-rich repeat-containing N-terminal plant-type domain-containing protein n=1 Tax=Lithocarpus litseifolius TaxID=425828 RepID=A0AAW2DR14_9ROSI